MAFLGVLTIVGVWTYREARDPIWAAIVPLCILSIDRPLNHWFTSVNVDVWYLGCLLAAMYIAYFYAGSRRAVLLSAFLAAAAFGFKQQAFLVCCGLFLYLLSLDWRLGLRFGIACASFAGTFCSYFLLSSGGYFWTYAVAIPMSIPAKARFDYMATLLRVSPWGLLMFVSLWPAVVFHPEADTNRHLTRRFWLLMGLAFVTTSWLSFRKEGGGVNSLAPVLMMGFVLFGMCRRLLVRIGDAPVRRLVTHVSILLLAFLVVRVAMVRERKLAQSLLDGRSFVLPWNALHPGYEAFEQRVSEVVDSFSGRVFVGARVLPLYQRKRPLNTLQTPLYNATFRTSTWDIRKIASDAFRTGKYSAVVLWEYPRDPLEQLLSGKYRKTRDLGPDPLIGFRVSVWVRADGGMARERHRKRAM